MKRWQWGLITAAIAVVLFVKIDAAPPGGYGSAIQLGMPWRMPVDSLPALAVRSGRQDFVALDIAKKVGEQNETINLIEFLPASERLYNFSIWLSSLGRDHLEAATIARQAKEYEAAKWAKIMTLESPSGTAKN